MPTVQLKRNMDNLLSHLTLKHMPRTYRKDN